MKILVPHDRTLHSVQIRVDARRSESAGATGYDGTAWLVGSRLRKRSEKLHRPFEREEAVLAQPAKKS
jgi:hypothetical protein